MTTQEDYEEVLEKITVEPIGIPSMASYEALRKSLQAIARKLKTSLFPRGADFGHMALICEEEEYATYIGGDFQYEDPQSPEDFAVSLPSPQNEDQRKTNEKKLDRYTIDYNKYLATQNVLRAAIVGAVDEEYILKLKNPLLEYDLEQPFTMLQEVKKHVPLTTEQRNSMKAAIFCAWDGTVSLRKYINTVEQAMKEASYWQIKTLSEDVRDHVVKQIYDVDPFEAKVMTEWELKRMDMKTWNYCKEYFLREADKLQIHKTATAKQSGYGSAANVKEEVEDTSDTEENVNLVLEAMQASTEQMNAVAVTNSKLEAVVTEQAKQITRLTDMNSNLISIIKALGGKVDKKDDAEEADKENKSNKRKRGAKRGQPKMCEFCKKEHRGAGPYCLARKVNAHLRPAGWKGEEVSE